MGKVDWLAVVALVFGVLPGMALLVVLFWL